MTNHLLSRAEFARALRVSTATIDALRAAGTCPQPIAMGRRVLFLRQDVEAFLQELARGR